MSRLEDLPGGAELIAGELKKEKFLNTRDDSMQTCLKVQFHS